MECDFGLAHVFGGASVELDEWEKKELEDRERWERGEVVEVEEWHEEVWEEKWTEKKGKSDRPKREKGL